MNKKLLGFHSFFLNDRYIHLKGRQKKHEEDLFLIMILSALQWEKFNGGMKLYADFQTIETIGNFGCLDIYSRGIDASTIVEMKEKVHHELWSYCKLYALEKEPLGSVSVDTDLIIWRNIYNIMKKADVVACHKEMINTLLYCKDKISTEKGYDLPYWFNEKKLPTNTSLICFNDSDIKYTYLNNAYKFANKINKNEELDNNLSNLVFIEQWVIPMLAEYMNKSIGFVFDESLHLMGELNSDMDRKIKIELDNRYKNKIYRHKKIKKQNNSHKRVKLRRRPKSYNYKNFPLTHFWFIKEWFMHEGEDGKIKKERIWFIQNVFRILKENFPKYYEIILNHKPHYLELLNMPKEVLKVNQSNYYELMTEYSAIGIGKFGK